MKGQSEISLFSEERTRFPRPERHMVHRIDREVAIGRERADFDEPLALFGF